MELGKSNKPFFISIITADTHPPSYSFLEPECETKYHDSRDSFKCMDQVVSNFVKWCQKQPFYKDTVIFIMGDHTIYPSFFKKMKWFNPKKIKARRMYNVVLNDGKYSQKIIEKPFTQIDYAPTILESAGFVLKPRRLGLGVSLWSQQPTLLERYVSSKNFEEELKKSEPFFDDFFSKRK